ncbi:MAG: hypothetical protein JWM90_796 [Thermoleophilia bacterium]|nr:hypothetical protein [Thermoleophilia bacterium]
MRLLLGLLAAVHIVLACIAGILTLLGFAFSAGAELSVLAALGFGTLGVTAFLFAAYESIASTHPRVPASHRRRALLLLATPLPLLVLAVVLIEQLDNPSWWLVGGALVVTLVLAIVTQRIRRRVITPA